jgi:hypothetical protein
MSRPPRLDGFDYRGWYRYFLTICAYQRRLVFKDATTIDLVLEQIRFTATSKALKISRTASCPTISMSWSREHQIQATFESLQS